MKSLDDYKKELEKLYAASQAEDIAASDKKYETEKKLTNDQYNRQINETENSYEDLYRENAVQKLINEREVAENMANLGLTDSGLNRTQQTAVQLSYANNKNKIDTTRQKAVDQLTYSLADAISKLDTAKTEAAAGIKSNYASAIASGAQEMYNNAVEQERKYREAQLQAQLEAQKQALEYQAQQKANNYILQTSGGLLRRDFQGSLKDNNVDVIYNTDGTTTYIDNNSGKKTTLSSNINPYTGTINKDTANGVFSNGYQPNNVNGVKLVSSGAKANINGNEQTVWKANGKYYLWSGKDNKYIQLNNAELKEIGVIKR